jgi:pyridoxal biosynthesis lyase PdxS
VERYRAAHGLSVAHERGNASTEDLRHAVRHYRELFDSLVEAREAEEART